MIQFNYLDKNTNKIHTYYAWIYSIRLDCTRTKISGDVHIFLKPTAPYRTPILIWHFSNVPYDIINVSPIWVQAYNWLMLNDERFTLTLDKKIIKPIEYKKGK